MVSPYMHRARARARTRTHTHTESGPTDGYKQNLMNLSLVEFMTTVLCSSRHSFDFSPSLLQTSYISWEQRPYLFTLHCMPEHGIAQSSWHILLNKKAKERKNKLLAYLSVLRKGHLGGVGDGVETKQLKFPKANYPFLKISSKSGLKYL